MKPNEFVRWIYPQARELGEVSPVFVTAQAALESGWGASAIGNNLFGITKGSSWTGPVRLVTTTEWFTRPDVKFKAPEEVLKVALKGHGRYKYTVRRLFRDYATAARVYQGNVERRRFKSLRVEGTNNPEDESPVFDELASIASVTWSTNYIDVEFVPSKPYRAYRMVFNGCQSEGIEVGEIYFYSNILQGDLCRPANGLPGALENGLVNGPCPDMYEGSVIFQCQGGSFVELSQACTAAAPTLLEYEQEEYTLYTGKSCSIEPTVRGVELTFVTLPTLPAGLTINESTGVISGKPTTPQEVRQYTVTARNNAGVIQAKIRIAVVESPTPVWLYIVIVVAVIVVIAIIVVLIMVISKKSKSKKGKGKGKGKNLPKTAAPAPKAKESAASKNIVV